MKLAIQLNLFESDERDARPYEELCRQCGIGGALIAISRIKKEELVCKIENKLIMMKWVSDPTTKTDYESFIGCIEEVKEISIEQLRSGSSWYLV
ncbi:hypothetical protein FLK61_35240 [Paenalkalicoccus suaedae]|uniref:Uncharacterized protein n=1 Tax=Paenalkalicoccus suaedae TaxID=2592382 RepID=A0A859FI73_9BACI|nr:hypothetical protein [Paenalkalicoccus suaedae]QKS71925.1 hypothetical protein FLK61_35240 [Paenalkalicoccus suaedae]